MKKTNIKFYKMFNYNEHTYIINVDDMNATAIDDKDAGKLRDYNDYIETAPASCMQEIFKKYGLFDDNVVKHEKLVNTESVPPLRSLIMFLTQTCNLNCVYCYGDGGKFGEGGDMDEKTAFRCVDWLFEQSGRLKDINLSFFGGEPFLMFPLMKKIVAYTKSKAEAAGKNVDFYATSNATLFNDEIIDFIRENKISVLVSIDGPKEIHDAQRPYKSGKGSYDTIAPKIIKLLEASPKTMGHAVLVGGTNPQSIKLELKKLGLAEFSIVPASKSFFTSELNQVLPERYTKNLSWEIEKDTGRWLTYIKNKNYSDLEILKKESLLYNAILSLLHNSKRFYSCGAGLGLLAVSVKGDIYLCQRFVGKEQYILGSIWETELNRKPYQQSLDIKCSACFAKYYCAGGCKHDNATSTGLITLQSEDICNLRRRELELAGYVVSKLTTEDKVLLVKEGIFARKPCLLDF